ATLESFALRLDLHSFFNPPAPPKSYTLSLHDALPIWLANILRRQALNHSHSPQPLHPSVQQWLEQQGLGRIEQTERLAGGSINQVLRVTTTSDECFVVKLNPHCAEDFFLAEARSLRSEE